MIIDLKGRKAVVTGSTGGIGRAIAEGLARAGAAVVINGRLDARVTEALTQMRAMFPGADISGVAADVSTASGASSPRRRMLTYWSITSAPRGQNRLPKSPTRTGWTCSNSTS